MKNKSTKVLVLGSDGQLGQELEAAAKAYPQFHFLFLNRGTLDINGLDSGDKIIAHEADVVVNTAAYTAVDKSEGEPLAAFQTNAHAVARIAKACHEVDALLIHISTDYVYHGKQNKPMDEKEDVAPKNIYAISKLYGEKLALHFNKKTVVIRSSWIYSAFGNNFVKTMVKLGTSRKSLNVVSDQYGAPTNAADLSNAILNIVYQIVHDADFQSYGIYNYANEGYTTWLDFAKEIFSLKNLNVEVTPCTTKEFNAPALRPPWSVMSLDKIKNRFGLVIPHWRESLLKVMPNV
jgi:dTDP-4-dehydrorhamnose reductase